MREAVIEATHGALTQTIEIGGDNFRIADLDWFSLTHSDGEPLFYETLDNEPAPVLSPEQALSAFSIAPGFEVELVAADVISDRERYADSLARIAAGLASRPGFGMAMARSPQIVDRLRTLASRITARAL